MLCRQQIMNTVELFVNNLLEECSTQFWTSVSQWLNTQHTTGFCVLLQHCSADVRWKLFKTKSKLKLKLRSWNWNDSRKMKLKSHCHLSGRCDCWCAYLRRSAATFVVSWSWYPTSSLDCQQYAGSSWVQLVLCTGPPFTSLFTSFSLTTLVACCNVSDRD